MPTKDDEVALYSRLGGRPMSTGGETTWWFGMNPSAEEDTKAATVPHDAREDVPELTGPRVLLTDYPKMANGGVHPAYSYQLTGSCVHSGAWNAHYVLGAIESLIGVAPEVWTRPFLLPAYGYSRFLAFGRDSEGEGSSGDAMARAMGTTFGATFMENPELKGVIHQPTIKGPAVYYSAQQELFWSKAGNCPAQVKAAVKKHPVEYAVVKTLDEAEKELRRFRPLTWAGNWGGPMRMRHRGTGANRVLWGDHAGRWEHQQSCMGVWDHPEFGRIWNILQSWYFYNGGELVPVHGEPGTDEARGSYWIDDASFQSQLSYRFGEVRALKNLTGFDTGKLSHLGV